MKKYHYNGPVYLFDKVLIANWEAETSASTKEKAISNMTYQFKKKNNFVAGSKITLTGTVTEI